MMDQLPSRLAELLVPCPMTGCWLFIGTMWSRNGYGRVYWRGRRRQMHRAVWEEINGPIPDGLVLDHRRPICGNRACSNPDHLEPVTVRENTLRGEAVLFAETKRCETKRLTFSSSRLASSSSSSSGQLMTDFRSGVQSLLCP
jgi:hypothetical protein